MVRFGTIGTSKITEEFINGLRRNSDYIITVCYSRTLKRADSFIEQNSLNQAVSATSLEEMLDLVDIVYIASPNGLHYTHAKFFLENKKNVLVEKPLTFTVKELDELIDLANKNGVIMMEACKTIHLPQFEILKNWVNSNRVFLATFMMNQYSSRMGEVNMGIYHSVFDPVLGKGSTYDLLFYPVELAIALFGKIKRFHSFTSRLGNGVGMSNVVILEHENNILCNITCSKAARGISYSEIIGIDGQTLTFNHLTQLQNIRAYSLHETNPSNEFKDVLENAFIYEIDDFVNLVRSKDFDSMNHYLNLTRDTIEILENIELSK